MVTKAPEFDPDELRRKYREERDKRLGADRGQTLELTGDLAHYLDDPYTKPVARPPIEDQVEAVVIGAGLGGLLSAAKLRDAGIERIRIIDTAGDVGGVWYWNRYPGAMCDVESYIYLPLLEELDYVPKDKYSHWTEILAHAQAIARHYEFYRDALFQTAVVSMEWNETLSRWDVTTDRGDSILAQFVVVAIGTLSRPKLPVIEGIEDFGGCSFHTSRWDFGFTGGESDDNLEGLYDKVVGVIGTGATALQCVPPLGRSAKHLYVFQRTPSTVSPRNNHPTDEAWTASLQPGWQAKRMMNFSRLVEGGHDDEDLVDDGWTEFHREILLNPNFAEMNAEDAARAMEVADFAKMEQVRARIDELVEDPGTAEALKPWYAYFCKRPGFHDEYLQAFNSPSVTLVDTQGRGLDSITWDGVIANGVEYKLDCLVFATGFDPGETSTEKFGFDVVGRNGVSLADKWKSGLSTFYGIMTSGFPNLFFMPGPNSQSVQTINFMHMLQENAVQFWYIVGEVRRRNCSVVDVRPESEAEWVRSLTENGEGARDKRAFFEACTPGRFNSEGHISERPPQNQNFGGGLLQMIDVLEEWRSSGQMEGLVTTG